MNSNEQGAPQEDYLYRYLGRHGLESILKRELKITPPNEFADPFEFTPRLSASEDEWQAAYARYQKNGMPRMPMLDFKKSGYKLNSANTRNQTMNSDSLTDPQRVRTQLMIFWIIWGSILTGLVVIYVFLGQGPVKPVVAADLPVNLAGVVPLFMSIVIRWLVLPRCRDFKRALPLFIVGLAMAEACGLMGIFLGGPYRESLFVLGVLGVTSYVPLFAKRLLEPKGSGFIPNN